MQQEPLVSGGFEVELLEDTTNWYLGVSPDRITAMKEEEKDDENFLGCVEIKTRVSENTVMLKKLWRSTLE